jgi:hypothetical protein
MKTNRRHRRGRGARHQGILRNGKPALSANVEDAWNVARHMLYGANGNGVAIQNGLLLEAIAGPAAVVPMQPSAPPDGVEAVPAEELEVPASLNGRISADDSEATTGAVSRAAAPQTPAMSQRVEPAEQLGPEDSPPEKTLARIPVTATASRDDNSGGVDQGSIARLVRIASNAHIFRSCDGRVYAGVQVNGHREALELGSSAFEYWLIRNYEATHGALPGADGLNRSIRALLARAAALATTEPLWLRVAHGHAHPSPDASPASEKAAPEHSAPDLDTVYYLDLADAGRHFIEIRADGCRVVTDPPVWLRRPPGQRPLPMPRWDGSIDLLKKYVNLSDADFWLFVACLTAALRPHGPYPILILCGEQGSAKSTMARLARLLIDPNAAPLRALPASQRGFLIEAHNTWLLAYDNISRLSAPMSDGLCRMATGGGISTRALHSNDDEILLHAQRPMIFTGIDEFVHRSDVVDRCVFLFLLTIDEGNRRSEQTFWTDFQADYPLILGALLSAVAGGIRTMPQVQLSELPRMADFALWGEAVSRALGAAPGTFLSLYQANRRSASESQLEDSPFAQAILLKMEWVTAFGNGRWSATASEMLAELNRSRRKSAYKTGQWPRTPRAFSCAIRRLAPALRAVGINVTFDRTDNRRTILIEQRDDASDGSWIEDSGASCAPAHCAPICRQGPAPDFVNVPVASPLSVADANADANLNLRTPQVPWLQWADVKYANTQTSPASG